MKSNSLILLGAILVVLGTGGFALTQFVAKKSPLKQAEPIRLTLPASSDVEFMLLKELTAGGSEEGSAFQAVVIKNVQVDGINFIPAGTLVTGKVHHSRGASLAASLINQPTRLSIVLDPIKLADGTSIQMGASGEGGAYAFTRDNTDRPDLELKLDKVLEDEEKKQLLDAIVKGDFEGLEAKAEQAQLADILGQLNLDKSKELFTEGEYRPESVSLVDVLTSIVTGDFDAILGGDVDVVAQVVGELGSLTSSVDRRLRGMFKAPSITAPIGTRFSMQTMEDVTRELSISPVQESRDGSIPAR